MIRMLQSHYILIFMLLFSLPIIFFFAPHFLFPHPIQLPIPLPDELDDLSLFNRAISSSSSSSSSNSKTFSFTKLGSHNPTLKIAFLFLTNTDLFFSPLWAQFFNNTNPKLFNLYIHADPDAHVKDPGGVFKARFIPSKHTERSSATLISAAKRLMATAILDDPLNFYFALISQSCIPLHSFEYVYKTISSGGNGLGFRRSFRNHKSFIEILDSESTLPSRYVGRGKNVMMPEVPFEKFRAGSQFFVLIKKHALMVLRDRKLWRKFKLPCYKISSCYPEEHYFPTLLSMQDPNGCNKYTVTRVNWTDSHNGHPRMYRPPEVSPELIYTLRQSNFSHDYLFARKFSPDCLKHLMDMADTVIFND